MVPEPLTPAVARAYAALTEAGAPAGPDTLARAREQAVQAAQAPPQRPTAAAVTALLRAGVIDRHEARTLLGLPARPPYPIGRHAAALAIAMRRLR